MLPEVSTFSPARGGGDGYWKSGMQRGKLRALKQLSLARTGVRVAEGAGLENRYTRKGIVGSNPTLSVLLIVFTSRRRNL